MHLTTAAILLALGSVAVADIEGICNSYHNICYNTRNVTEKAYCTTGTCAIANGDEQKCTIQSLGPKGHPDLSSATCG